MKREDPRSPGDTFRKYLLGILPENEQSEVEERIFRDDAFFDEIEFAEDCLIDEYLSGVLPGEDEIRFTGHYLNSPERRRRLQLASSLRGLFGEANLPNPSRTSPGTAGRDRESAITGRWPLGLSKQAALAIAAVLVLAVGLATAVAVRSGRQARIAEEHVREMEYRARSAESLLAEARTSLEGDKTRAALAEGAGVTAFVLKPDISRGDEAMRIQIPPDSPNVRLVLERDATSGYPEYRLTITDMARRVIWEKSFRPPNQPADAAFVIDVPAHVFQSGSYIASLAGVDSRGHAAMPQDYGFRIVKR